MAALILTVSVWVSVDIYVEMLRDSPHLVGTGSLSPPLWPGLTSLGREISGEAGKDNTDSKLFRRKYSFYYNCCHGQEQIEFLSSMATGAVPE